VLLRIKFTTINAEKIPKRLALWDFIFKIEQNEFAETKARKETC